MRKIFGGLLGGDDGTENIVKDLVNALASNGVTDELWKRCLEVKDFDEKFEKDLHREELCELVANSTMTVVGLCGRCHTTIQGIVTVYGSDTEDQLTDEVELQLVNAMTVLTLLFSAVSATATPEENPLAVQLWAAQGQERPLAERVIDCVMNVLFLDGFTVDLQEETEEEKKEEAAAAKNPEIDAKLLWAEGVGPEGGATDKVTEEIGENRQLALRLLAAVLCGAAPATPPAGSSGDTESAEPILKDRAKYAEAMAAATLDGQEASRALLPDSRALEYLCSPRTSVPRRAELFYSLLSVALGYDPHGYSVPYAGYFSGAKEEAFTQLCLEIIGLLLLDPNDVHVSGPDKHVSRRPQEHRGSWDSCSWLSPRPHVFRKLLSGISSEPEATFVVSGLVTLLGTVTDERGTYLPRSVKLPEFLPELLVLVLHVAGCDNLVQAACREDDILDLAAGVLHVAAGAPDHMNDNVLYTLIWSIFLRLTAHRTVCVAFLEEFEGDVPDDVPDVGETFADLVFSAALKQLGEYFLTAKYHPLRRCVLDACLFCMVNLSPYVQELSKDVSQRLFALLERSGKSVQKRSQKGAILIPNLLEILENIVQYQYASNLNVTYGICARAGALRSLSKIVDQVAQGASDDAGAVGKSVSNGHSLSPRTDVSDMSTTPVSEETMLLWSRSAKAHLDPLIIMLEAVLPQLEAAVEKQEAHNPDEAKDLLPKSVLGMLPPPPVFTTRSLASCDLTHRACEHCLVACLAHGPLDFVWDSGQEEDTEKVEEQRQQKIKALVAQVQDEGAEGTANGASSVFAPPARGGVAGRNPEDEQLQDGEVEEDQEEEEEEDEEYEEELEEEADVEVEEEDAEDDDVEIVPTPVSQT